MQARELAEEQIENAENANHANCSKDWQRRRENNNNIFTFVSQEHRGTSGEHKHIKGKTRRSDMHLSLKRSLGVFHKRGAKSFSSRKTSTQAMSRTSSRVILAPEELTEWMLRELRDDGHQLRATPVSGFQKRRSNFKPCLLYTSPSPRDLSTSRMPSSA